MTDGESGLPLWQQLQLGMLLGKLSDWRNADHEDSIALCRSDICCLLDAFATTPAAAQSVDIDAAVAATANSIMAIRMMVDERAEPFVRKKLEALIRAVQSGGSTGSCEHGNPPGACTICHMWSQVAARQAGES